MRLRNVKNAEEILHNSRYFISSPTDYKGNWKQFFHGPIHIEIGCGKGKFLMEMAEVHPDIFFIGVEKYASVLVRAIQKVDSLEIPNLKFILWDALLLNDVFEKEIDTIYLNFSDPWPKKRHEKRRLTSPHFLDIYDSLFQKQPKIIQKTDNLDLFQYSLDTFLHHGYTLEKVSFDLAKEDFFNIQTEYEEKFSRLGYPIHYVEAVKNIVSNDKKC